MEKQQKIKLISLMYNVKFEQKSAKCSEAACQHGKCICMDRAQAGFLLEVFSQKSDVLSSKMDGECPVSEGFFPCEFTEEDLKVINKIIKEAVREGYNGFEEMLYSIPAIYLTNSSNEILKRDSLNYLCVYAQCTNRYLDRLLRTAICGAVECCLHRPEEQWSDYAQEIADGFIRLNDLVNSYEERKEELVKVIEDYSYRLLHVSRNLIGRNMNGANVRNAKNALDEFRNKLEKAKAYSICEAEKCAQWYRILKKIFEVMGIEAAIFPELSFVEPRRQASDYDRIFWGFGELIGNGSKRRSVFEKIQDVFSDKEVPLDGELIDKLIVAFGYTID